IHASRIAVTARIAAVSPTAKRWFDSPMTAPSPAADRTEPRLAADRVEPTEAADPTENADAAEPTDPIEAIEPTEPIESIEFVDAIESSESCDHSDHFEPLSASALAEVIAAITVTWRSYPRGHSPGLFSRRTLRVPKMWP